MSGNAPSPWSWSDEYRTIDGRSTWSLVAADGYGILSCDGEENSPQGINEPAIASLIASAPMLLEALKAMRTVMDMGSKPSKLDEALSWRACDEKARSMCDAAIAAATGETK